MKININIINVSLSIILLGIFFMPFNSWDGLSFLGEYSRDSCVLFFLTASLILMFKKKINLPLHSPIFYLLIVFLMWTLSTFFLNIVDITSYFFKQTSGYNRFFRQFISLTISAFVLPMTFYNVFLKVELSILLVKIRKVMLFSLLVVCSYAIIEILIVKFNFIFLKKSLLNLYDYLPFVEAKVDLKNSRISSITFESPALGTYLITVFSWLASYVLTSKKWYKFVPALLIIFLAFISGSRAAFFIILFQSFAFLAIIAGTRKYSKGFLKGLLILTVVSSAGLLISTPKIINYLSSEVQSFKLNDSNHSISNKSRFGIQYAIYKVFLQNPIIGVGYGQQAFESRSKYPSWAKQNNWEFRLKYLNQNNKRFPPGYNLYLRLVSETGIIGGGIFITFLIYILIWCYNNINQNNNLLGIIVFTSMVGFLFNWLKMDTFRIYGFWICLGLIFTTFKNKNNAQ